MTNETGNPQGNRPGEAQDQGAAAGSTGDGLDQFLKEYDQAHTSQQPADKPSAAPPEFTKKLDKVVSYVEQQEQTNQQKQIDEGIKAAVEFLGEDDSPLKDQPPMVRRALLMEYARGDENFVKAFENQNSDPDAWKSALGKAREKLASEVAPVKKDGSEDRKAAEAVAASVSGETRGDETDPTSKAYEERFRNMSDAEWQEHMNRYRRPYW